MTDPCSISPSMTARRKAPAQKCSIESWPSSLVVSPGLIATQRLRLMFQEAPRSGIGQTADRNDRKALIQLDGGQRVPGMGAVKGLLEVAMRDALGGRREKRAELRARGPHLQQAHDRIAAADPTGHEDRHLGDLGQDFLRQHHERDGPDMAARFRPFDDQGVSPQAKQPLRQNQRGGEADQLGATILDGPAPRPPKAPRPPSTT